MLATRRSARAFQEAPAYKEDTTILESSSPMKAARSRRALGDVSNKNSRNGGMLNVHKDGIVSTVENPSLRRSRRLSITDCIREDRNPTSEHETLKASALKLTRNCIGEDSASISTTGMATKKTNFHPRIDRKPEAKATKLNRNTNRTKKRQKQVNFDIESLLLEPRPKRKRLKSTTRDTEQRKKDSGMEEAEKTSVEINGLKFQTPDAVLPKSTSALYATNCRCSNLFISSDDDHCLLRKLDEPFDASKFTSGIATYDKVNEGNVGEVPAYVTDIFQRLFDSEKITRPPPSYMTTVQQEINSMMRAILVDWLVGVQMKFRLQPETLYLCVNIIDRYLSRATIRRRRLQLLGITALFVACKYEETYPLEVKDCVYVTDNAYNRQEVLDMEFDIVMVLGFKMTVPTAYPFLQRFLHVTNAPKIVRDLANFYTERMLQEYCMLNFRASLVACAAVCLAWNNPTVVEDFEVAGIIGKLPRVLDIIIKYTGFCEEEIRHTARVICVKIQPDTFVGKHVKSKPQLNKVHLKYRSDAYSNASVYEFPSHLDL